MAYVDQMIDFLSHASDEEWMYVACDVNYDEGAALILWMVSQVGCPQAAALAIYWLMSPVYVKESTSEVFDADRKIIECIEENYPQNYKVTVLGFDPKHDIFSDLAGYDWTSETVGVIGIPPVLRVPIDGKIITHKDSRFVGWLECRPPSLLDN